MILGEAIMNKNIDRIDRLTDEPWLAETSDIITLAARKGVQLSSGDIKGRPGDYTIDGMEWYEWLNAMTNEIIGKPYVLQRWDVTLTRPGQPPFRTFTWGETRDAACRRMAEQTATEEWAGWSFSVAEEPTPAA